MGKDPISRCKPRRREEEGAEEKERREKGEGRRSRRGKRKRKGKGVRARCHTCRWRSAFWHRTSSSEPSKST